MIKKIYKFFIPSISNIELWLICMPFLKSKTWNWPNYIVRNRLAIFDKYVLQLNTSISFYNNIYLCR